jgi:universal stress protein F
MKKPVLAAIDETPRSAEVLAAAAAMAHTFGSSLILCRVIAMPSVQMSADGLPVHVDLQTSLEEKAKAELNEQAKNVPTDLVVRLVTILDVPWQGICEVAQKEDVGLIVIGSHGYRALDVILGTTAAKVVNHADRSVMVVRGDFTS